MGMPKIRWLHISDLHDSGGKEFEEWLALQENMPFPRVDFLVFTGDLHNFGLNSFDSWKNFMNKLMEKYHLGAKDVFVVPGNHDVDKINGAFKRKAFDKFAAERLNNITNSTDDILDKAYRPLTCQFSSFSDAVKTILGEGKFPYAEVYSREWGKKVNIVHLNTALLSCSNSHEHQIVDTVGLRKLEQSAKEPKLPAIVLAHHSFYSISNVQQERLKDIFLKLNVRAYLHGDLHQKVENPILLRNDREIPCIAAPSIYRNPTDPYSQTGAYLYEWDIDSPQWEVTISPYSWTDGRWEEKPGLISSFPMREMSVGLWDRYKSISKGLKPGILPGIIYHPYSDSNAVEEYDNPGISGAPPMVELLYRHPDEKYFQLVGKGKQACGGTGKTCTLLNLATTLTNPSSGENKIIPLYISLKEVYGTSIGKETVGNRILTYAKKHYKMDEGEKHPKTLFLLDGFNEITQPSEQAECLSDIHDIMKEHYPDDAIIITSRTPLSTYVHLWEYRDDFYSAQLDDWTVYFRNCYVKELSKQQKYTYVKDPRPAPNDHIWRILDTPFYLVLYNRVMTDCPDLQINKNAQRWLSPAFVHWLQDERPNKITLMLQFILREISRLSNGESGERQSFFLMKVLPVLGYYHVLKDRLDNSFYKGPKIDFSRRGIYNCTYACLETYLATLEFWPEYNGDYSDRLEMYWGEFCRLYQENKKPILANLAKQVPFSTFLFGLLRYNEGKTFFCHDNYRDFFAAFHIANVVYMLSSGVALSDLEPDAQEIFLLQLEVFDHSILLDAEAVLFQYFGIHLDSEACFYKFLENRQDALSSLVLLSILIRMLDANIQHMKSRFGIVGIESYRCRDKFYLEFKQQFEDLRDVYTWIGERYGQFYVYTLSMLARHYRDRGRGQRDLVQCADFAELTALAEKKYKVPKADGYLQMGLCINAQMEDLLNCEDRVQDTGVPYDFTLAKKVYYILQEYNAGNKTHAIQTLRNYLFKGWTNYVGETLPCMDIYKMILQTAYQKYKKATDDTYRTITRLGFVSKAYLVLAAIGTSGGALNTLAQMLINQANLLEIDPRLTFFRQNPGILSTQVDAPHDYRVNDQDHFKLAYRVLRVVCGIRRGNQPYSHLKAAELILKGRVPEEGSIPWVEAALDRAINGDQPMGNYWKGRYYLNCANASSNPLEKNSYKEKAIINFQATGAAEFSYDLHLLPLPAYKWLSAIELLAFPEEVNFVSDRTQVYQAILIMLKEQIGELNKEDYSLSNEKYNLQTQDVRENLTRFYNVVKRHFSPDEAHPVEDLLASLSIK